MMDPRALAFAERIELLVAAAAERFPVGKRVFYSPISGEKGEVVSAIRSAPWALGHGAIIVKIEGRSGGVLIDHLKPLQEADQ